MSVKDTMSKVETKARTQRREIENATTHDLTLPPASSTEMLWFVEKLSKAALDLQAQVDGIQERLVVLETKPKRKPRKKKSDIEKSKEIGDAS